MFAPVAVMTLSQKTLNLAGLMLDAYVACVKASALSSLAFRFVVAGIPPILLAGRLAFMILRECWDHYLFGHVDLSSKVAALCDNRYSGVLQRLVSGLRKSFPRPFVSRVSVALAWSDSSSQKGNKGVCL